MRKIKVNVPGNEYFVYIGSQIKREISSFLKSFEGNTNTAFVVDSKLYRLHKLTIDDIINSVGGRTTLIKIHATEENKSLETVATILKAMLRKNFGRDSLIVGIGGGIVGDITGFAASIFLRGVPYMLVPTTLLACVDSSVGGKTGVNFSGTKNIVGAFHQPSAVFIDTDFLKTLDERELLCGIGELIKYAYITDENNFNYINNNINNIFALSPVVISEVIELAINFKASVVASDERESGLRKILNFGHTFAHAIESERKHALKHGEAVIVGISCALQLSFFINLIDSKKLTKFSAPLLRFYEMIDVGNIAVKRLYQPMLKDKKNRDDEIRFVLIKDLGKTVLDVPVSEDIVMRAIKFGLKPFSKY